MSSSDSVSFAIKFLLLAHVLAMSSGWANEARGLESSMCKSVSSATGMLLTLPTKWKDDKGCKSSLKQLDF